MSFLHESFSDVSDFKYQIKQILSGKDFDYTVDELINNFLMPLDEAYHSPENVESIIPDQEYDALYNIARAMMPTHVYFTGVGSEVRGEKVRLPYTMGSLDQVYETDLQKWIEDNELEDEELLITEKLDGVSCMLLYDSTGSLQIAYSRGNGIEGADITRHIRKIPSVPKTCDTLKNLAVRAEVIISRENFKELQTLVKTRSNKTYKNARNLIAGLMNAKQNDNFVYEYIDVVAYEVLTQNYTKFQQLNDVLTSFSTPYYETRMGCQIDSDELTKLINVRKKTGAFEIDGVVIDVNSIERRAELNPTRDTYNPAYSVKYKTVGEDGVRRAEVVGIDWGISKHGYLKPRLKFKPIELGGVTIKHATGFNAKFVVDNNIGIGAVVELVRSGDVIPFVQKVVCQADGPLLPDEVIGWKWNETGVDIVLNDPVSNPEVKTQQLIDFFTSLNVAHLREGNIRKFVEYTNDFSINSFLNADVKDWQLCIGANGKKIFDSIQSRFLNIPIYELMGASSFFGRGIGKRKFKLLLQAIEYNDLLKSTVEEISMVDGFDQKTAVKIVEGIPDFIEWVKTLPSYVTISYEMNTSDGKLKGHKVCFTGFRDAVLSEKVESLGGTMQSAVSSKTTYLVAADPNSKSGKIKKARQSPGTTIFSIDEFKTFLSED